MIYTLEQFIAKYRPLDNEFTTNGRFNNTIFESKEDVKFIQKRKKIDNIWSIVNPYHNDVLIIPGFEPIRKSIGYFITQFHCDNISSCVVLSS